MRTARYPHIACQSLEDASIDLIELGKLIDELVILLSEGGTSLKTPLVHRANMLETSIDAVDRLYLRTDALELKFVDGIETCDIACETLHLC